MRAREREACVKVVSARGARYKDFLHALVISIVRVDSFCVMFGSRGAAVVELVTATHASLLLGKEEDKGGGRAGGDHCVTSVPPRAPPCVLFVSE